METRIPLTLIYNCFCPNISKVIQWHWNLQVINESLEEKFNCQPVTAYKQNENLKELIENSKTENNKVKKRQIQTKTRKMFSMCDNYNYKVILL